MTADINILLLIPLVSILLYCIPVCYLDVRYREVNNWYWLPLVLVNLPGTAYLYVEGWYPWYCLIISLITVGIFAAMVQIDLLNGADFIFLSFIALFWIINPHPFPHGIQVQFYVYLLVSMILTSGCILLLNYVRGERKGWVAMMQDYPRGVPYMLTISLAFILSYLWG
jgi:Flp pilus assembly protein protease CpaA